MKKANIVEKGIAGVLGGIATASVGLGLAAAKARERALQEHETREEKQKRLIREVLKEEQK